MLALILAAALVGLGALMRVPWSARFYMLGLLYVAVLALQIALPDGHPMREATGGSLEPWIFIGVIAAAVVAYRLVLNRIRARAEDVQAEREETTPATAGPFNEDELERYARHITLPEIGGTGQRRLKDARVLVVGAGGLGAPALIYLAAAGVGRIGIIDGDTVALSNLARQIIHTDDRQDMPKVFSAQAAMRALNPFVEVRPYNRALSEDIAAELFADYDLILDGTDSYATRAMINRAACAAGKPLIAGAISAWEGQVTLYDPGQGAPCMACVFPDAPDPSKVRTCAETGVIGALPGVIGSMMALEAVKEITGAGRDLRGRMLIYDALNADTRVMTLNARADCPVCGRRRP